MTSIRTLILTLLLSSFVSAQTRPATQPLGSRGVRAHDPSTIVQCNGEHWIFATGRGVRSYHSKDLQTWQQGPQVFTDAPAWNAQLVPATRPLNYWAPDAIRLDDRYLLYYSVSVFGKNTSAIGLATNVTLDPADPKYKWVDEGAVVQSVARDNFNAIDPSVTLDRDGKLWMVFGSYWSGIKLIELDPKTGKRMPDSPMHSLAHARDIEAAHIFRHGDIGHGDDYFLFVNWGVCCRGVNSTYNIRVGRSKSITGPYLDKAGKDMLKDDAGTLLLGSDGNFVGPGHAGVLTQGERYFLSMHFYDGTRGGVGTLAIRELTWDADGWPVVED